MTGRTTDEGPAKGTPDGEPASGPADEEPAKGSAGEELARVRERAAAVRDEEVRRACSRLAAQGELTPRRRAVLERLADRLVERLLDVPARNLSAAEDRETAAETLRRLFVD